MNACPFPGLLPFGEKDAPFFFGRDREIGELLSRLHSQRFLGVVGVSGSGKSSLVHAGVKPELRAQDWRITEIKPGNAPAKHLAGGLSVELPGPDWASLLGGSSYGLSDGIPQALKAHAAGTKLLVIVDQFEEIFDYRERDAEGADLFVQQLLRAASLPGLPAYVLITMRTDFLGKCALFRNLPEALNEGSYLVPRLTRKEQEDAIRLPLLVSGVGIEPAVVDRLLNASETNRDELPVLQHLLKRLWEVSGGATITEAHLRKTGGWDEAIGEDAGGVFDPLNPQERDAVRLVFQRLTKKGTGDRPVRTPCSVAELAAIGRTLVTRERLLEVMEEFRKRDLLVWETEDRIDIPHECLTWRWETLAGWIEEEDRDRQLLDFIAASKRGNLPLAGFKLDEGLGVRSRLAGAEWAGRYGHDAGELATWIDFSADRQKHQARQRQFVMVGLVLVALLFGGLSWWAWVQKQEAEKARSETYVQRMLGVWQSAARQSARDAADHSDDDRSALLARQALLLHRVTPNSPRYLVEDALQTAAQQVVFSHVLSGHQGFVYSVAFSPDGTRLASASDDHTVRLWDLRQPQAAPQVLSGHQGAVSSVAFSPDGTRLASASFDQTVRLWDLRQPQAAPQVLSGHQGFVYSVAFSPDGTRLASASDDHTVRLWDLRQPQAAPQVLSGHQGDVNSVAFSPDGTRLASASGDQTVRLWDLRQPQAAPQVLSGHQKFVSSVAFSPDGTRLASAGIDQTVRLWDLRQPQAAPQVLSGHQGSVYSVAFSPDGTRLASASGDRTVRLWDLRQPQAAPQVLSGHQGSVSSVAFSPDGTRLASASGDRTVRLWDLRQPQAAPQVLSGHQGGVRSVAFSPDGTRLASASEDQTVRLWDLRQPQAAPQILSGHEGVVYSVAFSPDGTRLASASFDQTVRLWDLRQPQAAPQVLSGYQGFVYSVAFSPDGTRLASASDDRTVRLWDLRQPQAAPQVLSGHQGIVYSVAFSRDGTRLASAGGDRTVRLWDLRQPQAAPQVLSGHQKFVSSVAFSPDGTRLASASFDQTVRLWDLRQPQAAPQVLSGYQDVVLSVAFSPDGTRLASAGGDRTVRLWDLRQLQAAPQVLSGHQASVYSVAFSPDGTRLASASDDRTVRLWPIWTAAADYLCSRVWRNLSMEEWRLYIGEGIPYERTCPTLPAGAGAPK